MYSSVKLSTVVILIFFLFSACEKKKSNLSIDEASLIKLLCDAHIVEGALQNQKSSEKDSLARVFYQQIYEKHGITEEDFEHTLETMEKDPKLLQNIYSKVLVELDSLEEKSYKSKYKKK